MTTEKPGIIVVPEVSGVDLVFGNVKHLPPWDEIPERFKRSADPYAKFISEWFFRGLTDADLSRLTARDGIDGHKALSAVGAILKSFAPKHEHKEAGAAYLLSQWFELSPPTGAGARPPNTDNPE